MPKILLIVHEASYSLKDPYSPNRSNKNGRLNVFHQIICGKRQSSRKHGVNPLPWRICGRDYGGAPKQRNW